MHQPFIYQKPAIKIMDPAQLIFFHIKNNSLTFVRLGKLLSKLNGRQEIDSSIIFDTIVPINAKFVLNSISSLYCEIGTCVYYKFQYLNQVNSIFAQYPIDLVNKLQKLDNILDTSTRKILYIDHKFKNNKTSYMYNSSEGKIKLSSTTFPNLSIPCDFCNQCALKSTIQYNYVDNNQRIVTIHKKCHPYVKNILLFVSYVEIYSLFYCSIFDFESKTHVLGMDIIHYLGQIIIKYCKKY